MIGALLNKWVIGAAILAILCLTVYVQHQQKAALRAERDNAVATMAAYKATLQAYQDQYAAQAKALNTEKGREIARQERLLKTLNLAGDLNEAENLPVSGAALTVIDSMYGIDPRATGDKPAN